MNSSDLTSLIWLQQDDILKHINTSTATVTPPNSLAPKHFINVITSGATMAKPSILMFKPTSSMSQPELTQLVTSSPTIVSNVPGGLQQVEEIKYIEMKPDYNEDSFQSNSTGSSTLQSINTQVSPAHSLSSPCKYSPPSSSASSPNTSSGCDYKKPPFSYSQLVFMSIENSAEKALPLREIYSWIERFFPYYKNAPTGWKNSIRHELSYKNYFKKVTTTTKFIKGAWSVDKVYRPKLYTKLKSFLNHDDKLTHNLNKCLCESVSKYDLFSFINNNNDDEIHAASIIMEFKNNGPPSPKETPKVTKAAKRKHGDKYNKNNNNILVSNLNAPGNVLSLPQANTPQVIVADFSNSDPSMPHMKFYEISPHKRIKVEPAGELEGEEPVVNIKIEDPESPEHAVEYPYDHLSQLEMRGEIIVKEEREDFVEYDGTVVASEVVYQDDIDSRVKEDIFAPKSEHCEDIIRDPFGEIREGYEEGAEEEEEKRKRDGAACALLHLAGLASSSNMENTKSNAVAKSMKTKTAPVRRKLKVLKSSNSISSPVGSQTKRNNSWTLLTYPELFACSATSSSAVKTGDIER